MCEINAEMSFDSTRAYIFGPISTSSSFTVAVNFAENTGFVIEVHDSKG